ncbi:MAG: EthD family reductase [Mesorhizobium sp.]
MTMFKAMILLKRKETVSPKAFTDWWLGGHATLVRELPGVRRAVFNVIEDGPYDGVSELWFDTRQAFEAAYATPHGKSVAADTLAMVDQRVRMIVSENVIVGEA